MNNNVEDMLLTYLMQSKNNKLFLEKFVELTNDFVQATDINVINVLRNYANDLLEQYNAYKIQKL